MSKCLSKMRDWIIVLKRLVLVYWLLNDRDMVFQHEIMYATRRGSRLLNCVVEKKGTHKRLIASPPVAVFSGSARCHHLGHGFYTLLIAYCCGSSAGRRPEPLVIIWVSVLSCCCMRVIKVIFEGPCMGKAAAVEGPG